MLAYFLLNEGLIDVDANPTESLKNAIRAAWKNGL